MAVKGRLVWLATAVIATGLAFAGVALPSRAQEDARSGDVVFVLPVKGMIDPGLASLVRRSVADAEREGARAIIFEIDTPGGRVDFATQVRDAIFGTHLKTIAYINYRAISAGALIALACESIVVAPGSSIGAASPIMIMPGGSGVVPGTEKEVSYVRTEFVATAERNDHSTLLAKAMVDKDVELYARTTESGVEIFEGPVEGEKPPGVDLVIAKDKLLTLSGDEAVRLKLAEHEATTLGEVAGLYELRGARLMRRQFSWSENLARFLTNPIVSGLLLTFGFLGIIYELKIPGWGISGTVGLTCLALFFGAHLLVGLAEWVELLLFAVGIILLVAEVLFIPGFGVAGISGIACLLLAIYLALVKSPIPKYSWEIEQFRLAMYTVFWFVVALPAILIMTWKLLPRTPLYARIVQVAEERADLGFTSGSTELYMGKVGRTTTILRPAGRARFEGRLVDVVAEGEFIPPDTQVKVIDVKGNRIVVIPHEEVEES
ncbi:MAG: nodulation protein NfeD [Candidatus Hydrogenedentes bacterium]|nr:nodulation protein NfeD [Candidatus Hydrogenedentota bacterium]